MESEEEGVGRRCLIEKKRRGLHSCGKEQWQKRGLGAAPSQRIRHSQLGKSDVVVSLEMWSAQGLPGRGGVGSNNKTGKQELDLPKHNGTPNCCCEIECREGEKPKSTLLLRNSPMIGTDGGQGRVKLSPVEKRDVE